MVRLALIRVLTSPFWSRSTPCRTLNQTARIWTRIASTGHQLASVEITLTICWQIVRKVVAHVARHVLTNMNYVHGGQLQENATTIQTICSLTVSLVVEFKTVDSEFIITACIQSIWNHTLITVFRTVFEKGKIKIVVNSKRFKIQLLPTSLHRKVQKFDRIVLPLDASLHPCCHEYNLRKANRGKARTWCKTRPNSTHSWRSPLP